jgi:hypothetical protein
LVDDHNRRAFLTTFGLAALTKAVGAQVPAVPASGIDIAWFDAFKGKHKQVFDLGSFDLTAGTPLRQPVTYPAEHRELSHLEPPNDINVTSRSRTKPSDERGDGLRESLS